MNFKNEVNIKLLENLLINDESNVEKKLLEYSCRSEELYNSIKNSSLSETIKKQCKKLSIPIANIEKWSVDKILNTLRDCVKAEFSVVNATSFVKFYCDWAEPFDLLAYCDCKDEDEAKKHSEIMMAIDGVDFD